MRRTNFERNARVMAQITMEQLECAQMEEEQGHPISDPAVRLLKSHVHCWVCCGLRSVSVSTEKPDLVYIDLLGAGISLDDD